MPSGASASGSLSASARSDSTRVPSASLPLDESSGAKRPFTNTNTLQANTGNAWLSRSSRLTSCVGAPASGKRAFAMGATLV